ncbi:MAG TPA: cytochrome c biogenesis protein CcsA [Phycisphaerae bacterium]|nr:cytochrome c biogenesis protein CcsA [Phycisphaerae bacterium]
MRRGAATVCLLVCLLAGGARGGEVFDAETLAFAARVNADALSLLGVQYNARIAILDTLARDQLDQMYGARTIDSLPPAVAFLEVYLNAGRYADAPVIYVREKNMRAFVRKHLDAKTAAVFQRTNRLPPASLLDTEAWHLLIHSRRAASADMQRAGGISSLREALPRLSARKEFRVAIDRLSARYSSFLATEMLHVAPSAGDRWLPAEEAFRMAASAATRPAGGRNPVAVQWAALRDAWRSRDAGKVNLLIVQIGMLTALAAGPTYPSERLGGLERLYNQTNQFTIVWIGYAVALGLLILAAASGRRWPQWAGLGFFCLSTLGMLVGFVVRWLISGRAWYLPPIMNQFEAVIGSALLGALIAIVLELAWRKSYFALAASLYATIALLSGVIFPEQMGAGIRAQHGILSSPVMAAHVTVIIIGHALVGMTFFISLAYLGVLAFAGSGFENAPPSGPPDLRPARDLATLAVIDRCNLIVAQLACWTVVVGTILGAYWGDFAWGRWWGWDPKETWALITCLVYVILLHVRFVTPVRWRGLVTALICILGCLVMLFNWIVVNFFLAGKHSYA